MIPLPRLLPLLALLAWIQGPRDVAPGALPKGNRILGIAITEAEDGDFNRAFALARAAGMQTTSLPLAWDELETSPGVFAPNPNWLAVANAFYPGQGVALVLEINPIDTNNLRVPPDLSGLPFDDPALIARFTALLDWVFSQVPNLSLVGFVVGNEVDAWLGNDPAAWAEYETFFRAAATHARGLRTGLAVGVKITLDGMTGAAGPSARSLNRFTDVVMVNHYPLNPDFTVKPPRKIRDAFDTAAALHPGRTLFFTEIGYPTGALCNSSEAMQAEFVRQAFRAWDAHRDQVRLVEFVWQTDLSPAAVSALTSYYGVGSPTFREYLATLGMRRYPGAGSDKPGFRALRRESRLRGW